ncbi:MAG: FG-GAP-like repeat-containing protein [Planctomycetota bacterium]
MKSAHRLFFRTAAALLLALGAAACSKPADPDFLRARAEIHLAESNFQKAIDELKPLTDNEHAEVRDLVLVGLAASQIGDVPSSKLARECADRALAAAPRDPAANYLSGNLHSARQEYEQAEVNFRTVLERDPEDLAATFQYACTLDALGRTDESMVLLERIRAAGVAADGPLYAAATYRLGSMLISDGKVQEGLALKQEHLLLDQRDIKALKENQLALRGYGRVQPPAREPVAPGPPSSAPSWPRFSAGPLVDLHGARGARLADVDGDGLLDLIGFGPRGLVVARQVKGGSFRLQVVHDRSVLDLHAADLHPGDPPDPHKSPAEDPRHRSFHPPLELLCLEAATPAEHTGILQVYALDAASDTWSGLGPSGLQAGNVRALLPVDFDHDGLLDVAAVGDNGLGFFRNLGLPLDEMLQMPFEAPEAGAALGRCVAVLSEDLDSDNDVDFAVVTESEGRRNLVLLDNLRGGSFSDVTSTRLPAHALTGGDGPWLLDLDEDGHADLVRLTVSERTEFGLSWARGSEGGFRPDAPLALPPWEKFRIPTLLADLDLDGHLDVLLGGLLGGVSATAGPLTGRLASAEPREVAGAALTDLGAESGAHELLAGDLDADLDLDLVLLGSDGRARVLRNEAAPAKKALLLKLSGRKANAGCVGAVVQVLAGSTYRRIYWRGEPVLIGLGAASKVDILRVVFTNGVVQGKLDVPSEAHLYIEDKRQGGSCPFLYTWNGERFVFVTDVLGTTPLGLPMAPGQHVPFDHDEWVVVRGDQLQPRDGQLELVLTEEMQEVTYLDGARLQAVDHPADVEIQPNEGFVFPPFPPHELHSLGEIVAAPRVTGVRSSSPQDAAGAVGSADGEDFTALVARVDDEYARPFQELAWSFKGLADPWTIEIALAETPAQRAALQAAPRLRLLLTGWFQWSDASVNLAAARHPEIAFEPPRLWVPDGAGGWITTGPPIGFPAGKTKSMVVDVTDLVRRDDPRLRLTSTLAISWDAIRLALDAGETPVRRTELPLTSAGLWWRGFSAPLADDSCSLPERFDWERLEEPRWNQHPGRYTRYGEVAELLPDVDNRYVIFGAGDAVSLKFSAASLPPLPEGWTRDWLLYVDGWAKDRDPNSTAAERVEPLPFHGMSDYPPPPGEEFPWTDALRAWNQEWNTREGAVLLPPLAPLR